MNIKKFFAIGLTVFAFTNAYALRKDGTRSNDNNNTTPTQAKAAACAASSGSVLMEFNNVRTLIEVGGSLWQDRTTGSPSYEVPKNSDIHSLYSGGLWMGGFSPDGQLKLAGIKFRADGNDFYPGPLTIDGTASIDQALCDEYDVFFEVSLAEVELHKAFYECQDNPNCDVAELFPNGYSMPQSIKEWPGNGPDGTDFYLAPFKDYNGNGFYDPENGDYPFYDIDRELDCPRKQQDIVPLFGDNTYWWVFNDKGNIHSESGGQPIGMEVRAQAFTFNTTNEINNMTFYNYVMINQGTQTLNNTYFAQYVDADLGGSDDDYVGCDVERGLGYCYNGDNNDDLGTSQTYGANPPAVGVDFFEGPFQDADNRDNPGPNLANNYQNISYQDALLNPDPKYGLDGVPYAGLGIGYGDGIVDNERFGMRRFTYYTRQASFPRTDPASGNAAQFYQYMVGIWQDGTRMTYGGTGYSTSSTVTADYAFPRSSDPVGWGTSGITGLPEWSEETEGNPVGDRRFLQSAGPFTLLPGDVNNITVGVVWARGSSNLNSIKLMFTADVKAQALFDNCFRLINGPDAPDLAIQELNQELILTITNPQGSSNNYDYVNEDYVETDNNIPLGFDRDFTFQGYKIFQLADNTVSVADLGDATKARLVAQCDVQDSVADIRNYETIDDLGFEGFVTKVEGANQGIQHSFRIKEDKFATGNTALVNYKTYYYMAIAYAYNSYGEIEQDPINGPYLEGRKSPAGEIRVISGIPHSVDSENNGTITNAQYGDQVQITRLDGMGNGGNALDLTPESEAEIMSGAPWKADRLVYESGRGPVVVKVIDPLSVPQGTFRIAFRDTVVPSTTNSTPWRELNDAYWELVDVASGNVIASADRAIDVEDEKLVPELGISITIAQHDYDFRTSTNVFNAPLESEIFYKSDASAYIAFMPDVDGQFDLNWIRSGTVSEDCDNTIPICIDPCRWNDRIGIDNNELWEIVPITNSADAEGNIGFFAPWSLMATQECTKAVSTQLASAGQNHSFSTIARGSSVDLVITPDKSKWTRCVVLETGEDDLLTEGGAKKLNLRAAKSVDKNGLNEDDPEVNLAEANLVGRTGMGWFPGYAVNLETGERLNIAFGENSGHPLYNGRDMIFNPYQIDAANNGFGGGPGGFDEFFAGMHYIYIFKNAKSFNGSNAKDIPAYDESQQIYDNLSTSPGQIFTWRGIQWAGVPFGIDAAPFLGDEVRVKIRVGKPYENYVATNDNGGLPLYEFSLDAVATQTSLSDVAVSSLDIIRAVPNPYYAFSAYETSRLDNRIKITNLPRTCTIKIFNMGGTLVRTLTKDNDLTFVEWDLKNEENIPIAGGMHIIHVDAPGIGEKIIKWFGIMRPVDLDNF